MASILHQCDSCEISIPFHRARVHCQICPDYDLCADCHATESVSGAHCIEHGYEVYKGGCRLFIRSTRTNEKDIEDLCARLKLLLGGLNSRADQSSTSPSSSSTSGKHAAELSVSDSAAAEALAVEIARQQMIARQQTLVRQQLENNHFANMLRATANRNVLGGWRTDANGDEYYEEGYI